jgi:hypothetical protein
MRQLTESGWCDSREMLDTYWKLSRHVMGSILITFSMNESEVFLTTEEKEK